MASQRANRIGHRLESAPFPPEQSSESQVERLRIMREGLAMKREGKISLFREDGQVSEFLAFRAGAKIARKVAFDKGVSASLNFNGLSEIAFCRIKNGQIVKTPYSAGMFGPHRFLPDGQRPLKQRLGLRILALVSIENCETFYRTSDIGMPWPQRLLLDGKRPSNHRLCLRVVAFLNVESGEMLERLSDAWMF